MKQEIIAKILGEIDVFTFCVAVFYAFVGAALNLLLHANKRDVSSAESPVQFSYRFLIHDNARRILSSIILILVCVRFSQELLGQQLTTYLAFIIGFSVDKLSGLLKKIGK